MTEDHPTDERTNQVTKGQMDRHVHAEVSIIKFIDNEIQIDVGASFHNIIKNYLSIILFI